MGKQILQNVGEKAEKVARQREGEKLGKSEGSQTKRRDMSNVFTMEKKLSCSELTAANHKRTRLSSVSRITFKSVVLTQHFCCTYNTMNLYYGK